MSKHAFMITGALCDNCKHPMYHVPATFKNDVAIIYVCQNRKCKEFDIAYTPTHYKMIHLKKVDIDIKPNIIIE